MIAAVIPVYNEGKHLAQVFKTLANSVIDVIIPIFNGCTDDSLNVLSTKDILSFKYEKKIIPNVFPDLLGIDVPRAIGAKVALDHGAEVIVFVDGDMSGPILGTVNSLVSCVKSGQCDMALTDCYQNYFSYGPLAQKVLFFRRKLNSEIGLFQNIGVAIPSHGPHAISQKLAQAVPLNYLAIPPVYLALSSKKGFKINMAASIPHCLLGSNLRSHDHVKKIAETIIGDCIEAIEKYRGVKVTRSYQGIVYNGYHKSRDFHTLAKILEQKFLSM